MMNTRPFYSSHPDAKGSTIYHTHPLCRIAQQIAPEARIEGMGEDREQCPFCFVLGEFQTNREQRRRQPVAALYHPAVEQRVAGERAVNRQNMRQAPSQSSSSGFNQQA